MSSYPVGTILMAKPNKHYGLTRGELLFVGIVVYPEFDDFSETVYIQRLFSVKNPSYGSDFATPSPYHLIPEEVLKKKILSFTSSSDIYLFSDDSVFDIKKEFLEPFNPKVFLANANRFKMNIRSYGIEDFSMFMITMFLSPSHPHILLS